MSDPTSKHKPYTTGAEPSTTDAKANVHMSNSGWVRTSLEASNFIPVIFTIPTEKIEVSHVS